MPDVRDVSSLDRTRLDLWEIVPLVETQILSVIWSGWMSPHHDAVERLHRGLHVVDVSTRDHCREGRPSLVRQDVPLGT